MTTRIAPSEEQLCQGPDPHPGMIRLPVAPRSNHRLRFSPLHPGKTEHILPQAALARVVELRARGSIADAVLIHGPGDPLADAELPLATVALLRTSFPALTIVIRTLGLGGLQHADGLQRAGASEIELLADAVEPTVAEQIYAWIRPGFKTIKLSEAAAILCDEQTRAVQAFKDAGLHVRLITTLYPTVNDDHLELLARKMADLGADEMILQPYVPQSDSDITLPAVDPALATALASRLSVYLPVTISRPAVSIAALEPDTPSPLLPKPSAGRPNIAVVSSNGMDIDLHLGQAPQLLVYGPREDGLTCLLECRPVPDSGSGNGRWDLLADRISDCFALLTANAGERPRRILDGHGIQVIITENSIDATVDTLYSTQQKGCKKRPAHS